MGIVVALGFVLLIVSVLVAGSRLYQSINDVTDGFRSCTVCLSTSLDGVADAIVESKQMRTFDEIVETLNKIASRPQSSGNVGENVAEAYKVGLSDGATEFAKYILEQLKEDK